MSNVPPPHPNGHQPVEGEGITEFSLRISRAKDYQTVSIEAGYAFPTPTSYSDALPALDSTFRDLNEEVASRLEVVLGDKEANKPEPVRSTPPAVEAKTPTVEQAAALVQEELQGEQVPVASSNGTPNWQTANKPNGKGTVRYIAQSDLSEMDLVNGAKEQCEKQGLPADQVVVWDNRDRLSKNNSYSAGSVQPKQDSYAERLLQELHPDEDKFYIGDVEFSDDGNVKVYINQKGQEIVTALKAASVSA